MPTTDFGAFRHRVLRDPALQRRLLSQPDPSGFPTLVAELAASLGLTIDPAEVIAELRLARQARSESSWT